MALDPHRYSVVWFAPLEIEARAAACMLDNLHDGYFALGPADDFVFQAGDLCGYNGIIASFPAGQEYGTSAAAALASQVKIFFPNLHLGFLVGVAAGLPDLSARPERDIRLGDILVALSCDDQPAVIAYDLGKRRVDGDFSLLRSGYVLSNTKTVLRSAIGSLKAEEPHSANSFLHYYHAIEHMQHANGTFVDPGQENDHYFVGGEPVQRKTRPDSQRTRVWYGAIGSGDTLMKDAQRRNELRERYGILGLEMEAAGIMNHIPVAVIRGVCDYGDEYKHKGWQPYAAAMAAAYAKAVLQRIPPKPAYKADDVPYIRTSRLHNYNGTRRPKPSYRDTQSVASRHESTSMGALNAVFSHWEQSERPTKIRKVVSPGLVPADNDNSSPSPSSGPSRRPSLDAILSGDGQREMEVPQALGQATTLIHLFQSIMAPKAIIDWNHPLTNMLMKYLRTALSIPQTLSSKIIICDFLGRDLHLELPIDWYDLRVILLPYFDTRERHGFEKVRTEEFLVVYCDQSEKRFKRIGPSNWEAEVQHGRKFHMSAIITHLQLEGQVCTACQARMKKFRTYLACPNCGLFSLSAQHQQRRLTTQEIAKVSASLQPFLSAPHNQPALRQPVGMLSHWEQSVRIYEIRKIASPGLVSADNDESSHTAHTTSTRREDTKQAVSEEGKPDGQPSQNEPDNSSADTQTEPPEEQYPTFEKASTGDSRRDRSRELEEIRHFKNIFIQEDTVLYDAALAGDVVSVERILTRLRASKINVDGNWGPFGTPLVAAILRQSDAVVEALLLAGADPLLSAGPLGFPLCVAAMIGNKNAIEIMLSFILNSKTATDTKHLQSVLDTALYRAVDARHLKLTPLLLYAGANPFAATKEQRSAFALLTSQDATQNHPGYATTFIAEGYGWGLITSDEARLIIDAVHLRYVPVPRAGTPSWLDACCRSIEVGRTETLEKRVAIRLDLSVRKEFLSWTPFWRRPPATTVRGDPPSEVTDVDGEEQGVTGIVTPSISVTLH